MDGDKNNPGSSRKRGGSALCLAPRKKVRVFFVWSSSNPLVLHGQHFGCTVFAFCNYPPLLTAGILFNGSIRREHRVFIELIDSYSSLLDRLTNGEEEDVIHVGELLGKEASGARGDDTKTLKSAILEWLVPRGQAVIPPLFQNIKSDHGFNHEVTGALLCPAGLDWSNAETKQSLKSGETAVHGDQWPMFLYAGYHYDPEDPWKGLLKSEILIYGVKHVFTSPSSVDKEPKATRSGNAYLHGMKSVTKGSVAYIVTQVQFSLCSSSVFSWTDMVTDSKNFYISILDLLEDPDESQEVADLMTWWTQCIMHLFKLKKLFNANSALSKIRAKCAAL
ncbi:uncharacterized protein HD556DRAFT_1433604 [Suillus plorans]|uniref:Uncharacterized protein n=1 Tax=Suillus plorans TaxID=116603 RepID=A0A9P7A8D1_9AGAM|nr:uncharacterized protein HD556DRAFT_1435473 [Suillus plorans]XP_041156746.1 uncharacterized protein HD556DRAFT_1433604 [Suillus plorans]KAG1784298.1 hypothetical protein HD556DRAFT_1435473 [Suillus plorans]KAG1789716.1 hypothetical protein HD556DRAFT_1433604 [Suillus plorans]